VYRVLREQARRIKFNNILLQSNRRFVEQFPGFYSQIKEEEFTSPAGSQVRGRFTRA
jgi:hypothetical protein